MAKAKHLATTSGNHAKNRSFWPFCWNGKLCHSQGPHPHSASI